MIRNEIRPYQGFLLADSAHQSDALAGLRVERQFTLSCSAAVAGSRARDATGSAPGRIGGSVHHPAFCAIICIRPARTSEDFPHPDASKA
jgi:hypothetical protein